MLKVGLQTLTHMNTHAHTHKEQLEINLHTVEVLTFLMYS